MNLNVFCVILVGRESETDFVVTTACVDQDASVLLPLRIYFSYGTVSRPMARGFGEFRARKGLQSPTDPHRYNIHHYRLFC